MDYSSISRRALLRGGAAAGVIAVGAVSPVVGAKGTSVTECTTIDRPGYYVLGNDLEGDGRSCIEIASGTNDVTIDGDGHSIAVGGVRASNSRNIVVKDLVVDGVVSLDVVEDARVTDVRAEGISLHHCRRAAVRRNAVVGGGIVLVAPMDCDISYNRCVGGSHGISVLSDEPAAGAEIRGNRLRKNTLVDNEIHGIYYGDSLGIDYDGPILNLEFISSDDVISDNYAARNGEYGIAVGWSSGVTLSRNRVFDNGRGGVRFNGCSNVELVDNRAHGNRGAGVHASASHSKFVRNRSDRNRGAGFAFDGSSRCHVKCNRARRNRGDGISLEFVGDSRFARNCVLRNKENGFALTNSSENTLARNTVCRNGGEPFAVSENSRDNQFVRNHVCAD